MPDIDLNKFPGNSKRGKVEKAKLEPVVKKGIVKRKKSPGSSFVETFLGDNLKEIGGYIFMDVLIPAAKDAINDMVQGGIEMLLYGNSSGGRRKPSNNGRGGYVSYNNYSNNKNHKTRGRHEEEQRIKEGKRTYQEIAFRSRGEADDVLDKLLERLSDYGEVSIADFYDAVGVTGDFTDNNWGWTDLSYSAVKRVREGYIIDFPKPVVLD